MDDAKMTMKRSLTIGVLALGAALGAAGCATTPVAQGSANTTATARKVLEGKWTLLVLSVTAPDGKRATPQASGDLNVDEFGNLSIQYRITDAGRAALESIGVKSPNPVISASGRVAIDPQRKTVTYMPPDANARALDADLAALRANPLALEHTRYYSVASNGVLTLTTRHENGKEATRATWKRAS
jgi:hypothetical protein